MYSMWTNTYVTNKQQPTALALSFKAKEKVLQQHQLDKEKKMRHYQQSVAKWDAAQRSQPRNFAPWW